jgi:hypothetical protein
MNQSLKHLFSNLYSPFKSVVCDALATHPLADKVGGKFTIQLMLNSTTSLIGFNRCVKRLVNEFR